ncbi:MAG: Sb-PDE family phosphodiesterase [Verrucomicrobiae bacterium]|nr:Sb-PDE family phosphodiesterase [Verrucomicrobiae bacterium]
MKTQSTIMNKLRAFLFVLVTLLPALCWTAPLEVRRDIHFPNLPGYQVMACDFHMHTVFSDGTVWPTIRVNEAWRQGLHAIAVTDHIEYQPHKADVPTNHGRSHTLAESAAKSHNLILIKGAEITPDTPPGHFNAVFLSDVKPLDTPEFLRAIEQANQQGAFVFWNHHAWKGEEKGRWLDVHQTMYDKKWFQGMEVANGDEYYPTAHQWCLEKKLTMLGNSDIHEPDLRKESASEDHRTMTLVFVKERTPAGIKEALLAGRTIVWFKDQLMGREELLRPFFNACIEGREPNVRSKSAVVVEVRNNCQADICLEPAGPPPADQLPPRPIVLPANSTVLLRIPVTDPAKPVAPKYTAKNFLVGPGKCLSVTLKIPGQPLPGKKSGK